MKIVDYIEGHCPTRVLPFFTNWETQGLSKAELDASADWAQRSRKHLETLYPGCFVQFLYNEYQTPSIAVHASFGGLQGPTVQCVWAAYLPADADHAAKELPWDDLQGLTGNPTASQLFFHGMEVNDADRVSLAVDCVISYDLTAGDAKRDRTSEDVERQVLREMILDALLFASKTSDVTPHKLLLGAVSDFRGITGTQLLQGDLVADLTKALDALRGVLGVVGEDEAVDQDFFSRNLPLVNHAWAVLEAMEKQYVGHPTSRG